MEPVFIGLGALAVAIILLILFGKGAAVLAAIEIIFEAIFSVFD